jgi:ATP-binding cassette, subfamily B, bacterial IrtB/YbtQ
MVLAGLAVIDVRLAIAAVVAGAVGVPGLSALRRRLAAATEPISAADVDSASRVVEYVNALPVLKAADQIGERSERLMAALETQGRQLNRAQTSLTRTLLALSLAAELAVIAVVAVGVLLTLDGELDVALVAAVVVAAVRFAEPVTQSAAMTGVFEFADHGLRRIDELLAVEPLPVPDDPTTIDRHDLAFEHVSFTYRDQPAAALQRVSFSAPQHSLTALVGPSGSGKSTILRLLTRYADPQHGAVRIGGVDLRHTDPRELMRHLAVVYQDVVLFDTTIADNVRMARPDATDDDVEAALHAANCGALLSRLPHGPATNVGEVGNRLSGGERQRLAIARALLKDAPIVLLDEPTSALDADSEVVLQDAIDRLVTDRTVLVIAHRLSTVVAADQILVLEEGRITERGTHQRLLEADGRYAAMWNAQRRARTWKVRT